MSIYDRFASWRSWIPLPTEEHGIELTRWLLLEANRFAVITLLLSMTFFSIIAIGTLWTFEMQRLLTETQAVQTVLNTFMSGVILLVSIVVSVNSIVFSYDITPLRSQEDRIEGIMEFQRELDQITDIKDTPSDPQSFLQLMIQTIRDRSQELEEFAEEADGTTNQDIMEHVRTIAESVEHLERSLPRASNSEFGALWIGIETYYGPMMNHSHQLASIYGDDRTETIDELIQVLALFATGGEYFKTLYYAREFSDLSLTLLIVSLPSIIITASSILAINANLLPEVIIFQLPSLLTFVAISFTVALAPYLVLTSYVLRVATVARRTANAGPFVLGS